MSRAHLLAKLNIKRRAAGRGGLMSEQRKFLGHQYIARRACGKVSASCWDDKGHEKDTAKFVAKCVRRGDTVERIERHEGDSQLDWICRPGCNDCRKEKH